MKQSTKQFERQFIRKRNAIERKGISIYRAALTEQYRYVLEKLKYTDFRQWVNLPDTIPEKPIQDAFERFYPMSSTLATMTYTRLKKGKATDEEQQLNSIFSRKLTDIVRTVCGDKIVTITSTSKDKIKKIIRDVIDESETEGIGIPEMTSKLYRAVGANLRGNGYARAKAIAQTEVISASNQASEYAAKSTGYQYRKFWSTSGLPNIRLSHIEAEQHSEAVNGLMPDERFPNGLLYPGDPAGEAAEIINCYTGDMEIKSAIVSAQRFLYSGDMIKIITVGGKILTVTPNHYILTENGFIRARNINKGDNLVCNTENIKTINRFISIRNNINNKKSVISEVFNTLVIKFGSKFTPVIGLDFDNDGKNGKGNIDIVNTNVKLLLNGVKRFQDVGDFRFKQTDSQSILIKRFCSLNFSFNGMFRTSNFFMRFFNLFLSLFDRHFTPFKFFGIGLTPQNYSLFKEMPINRYSWNTIKITKLINTHSTLIHLDEVAKVEVFKFYGHVYDFTSLTGTNIVNNIYTSNCRCTIMHEII